MSGRHEDLKQDSSLEGEALSKLKAHFNEKPKSGSDESAGEDKGSEVSGSFAIPIEQQQLPQSDIGSATPSTQNILQHEPNFQRMQKSKRGGVGIGGIARTRFTAKVDKKEADQAKSLIPSLDETRKV